MLRRSKRETVAYFRPETEMSFADQLAEEIPHAPKKVRIPEGNSGQYELSWEQADLTARMIADYRQWIEGFNADRPPGTIALDPVRQNAFAKFELLQKVIYAPEYFGIEAENPVFAALDPIVGRRFRKGEKIILWAFNQVMIQALDDRYRHLGVKRIDGQLRGEARERAREDFQEDPQVRILVANYEAGGVGLTLSAADAAIFVQLPLTYPELYQAEGRHQRLIGRDNLRHAKEQVEVEWMIPKFPEGFVEGITDLELKRILSYGTLTEQTRRRLEGGEYIYNLVMEGIGKPEDLETYFKAGILKSMGLNRDQKLEYIPARKCGRLRNGPGVYLLEWKAAASFLTHT